MSIDKVGSSRNCPARVKSPAAPKVSYGNLTKPDLLKLIEQRFRQTYPSIDAIYRRLNTNDPVTRPELDAAGKLVISLNSKDIDRIVPHRLVNRFGLTLLDGVAEALAGLGIAREDFPNLDWSKSPDGSPIAGMKNVWHRVFKNNPALRERVAAADNIMRDRAVQPAELARANEVRIEVEKLITYENLNKWGLSGFNKCFKSVEDVARKCFPFITDPRFAPLRQAEAAEIENAKRERMQERVREKVFKNHPAGSRLAELQRCLAAGQPVTPESVIAASDLIKGLNSSRLEELGVDHHWGKPFGLTTLAMKAEAFSFLDDALLKKALPEFKASFRKWKIARHWEARRFQPTDEQLICLYKDLVINAEQSREAIRAELVQLYQFLRQASSKEDRSALNETTVEMNSRWVMAYSIYIFDDLFGLTCADYLRSADFSTYLNARCSIRPKA
jgi:hypothetical protein